MVAAVMSQCVIKNFWRANNDVCGRHVRSRDTIYACKVHSFVLLFNHTICDN